MRKLISFLFISLDGVVESPNKYVRDDLYQDLDPFIEEGIAEQDAVLLGRKMYEEWSVFWPESKIEPFSTFINNTQKYVVSQTPMELGWRRSTLLCGDLREQVAALKSQTGKTIGVHGSISLVQSLLMTGLLDELRFLLVPAIAGQGRRLLSHDGDPIQLNLQSARTTPRGLQYMVYQPRL